MTVLTHGGFCERHFLPPPHLNFAAFFLSAFFSGPFHGVINALSAKEGKDSTRLKTTQEQSGKAGGKMGFVTGREEPILGGTVSSHGTSSIGSVTRRSCVE